MILTRIRLPAKLPWLVSCSFLLSRKMLSNIFCLSSSMQLGPEFDLSLGLDICVLTCLHSLSKTLEHYHFMFWTGCKKVFCVMSVEEPSTLNCKERGFSLVFGFDLALNPNNTLACTWGEPWVGWESLPVHGRLLWVGSSFPPALLHCLYRGMHAEQDVAPSYNPR